MTTTPEPFELYAIRSHDAMIALIDTLILADALDETADAAIDTATLINDITDPDPHDLLQNAINFLAFDCLDLDDDMLLDAIQNQIDTLIPN